MATIAVNAELDVELFCYRCGKELICNGVKDGNPPSFSIVPCGHCEKEFTLAGFDRALATFKKTITIGGGDV